MNTKNLKKEVSKNETGSDPRIKEHAVKIRELTYRVIELLDTIIALNNLETGNYSCSSDNIEIIPLFNNLIEKVEMNYPNFLKLKRILNWKKVAVWLIRNY